MNHQPLDHADWSDSNSVTHDEGYSPAAKAPSLSYERKIRLHKYAENRARSSLGLLSESSNMLWKLQDTKGDVAVFKPSSDWSEFVSSKAVVRANATFPNVLKTIYDLKTSDKFKMFLHKVLGEAFLDAEVLEDLNGTGLYPSATPVRDGRDVYKQASIKWWAVKSGNLVSKSSDFYVLEYIGIESEGGDIKSCYLFQESLAEVGGMPQTPGHNLERSQFNALICKFERLPTNDYDEEFVMISVSFQRPPPLVSLFRSNPAMEMVLQFARGLRDLLEDPPEPQEISVVKTSAWVKDDDRQYCIICTRKFSSIFRRRHHCRACGEVICWQCSSTIRVPSISFTHNETGKQVLSRHQTSIRVCTRCVVSHQRSKSGRELSNQEEFKEWIHRNKAEEQLAVVEELLDNQRNADDDDESQDDDIVPRQHFSRSLNEDEFRRQMPRGGPFGAEEEEKEAEHREKAYSSDGDNSDSYHRSTARRAARMSSSIRRPSQTPSQRTSSQAPRQSSTYEQRGPSSSRLRRSHSEAVNRRPSHQGSSRVSRTTLHPRDQSNSMSRRAPLDRRQYIEFAANQARAAAAAGSVGPTGNGSNSFARRPSSDPAMYNRRTGVNEKLMLQNDGNFVHSASAWATSKTETEAMTRAFQELLTKLCGDVHFLVVGFSTGFDADVIVGLLRQLAPHVPYIGGTIARGMCDENAWVSVNRHNNEGLVTMWGVNDPHGIYTIVHAEYSQSDAREKTFAATKTALARVAGDIEPGEKPAFVAAYACPLFVENAIDGIREAVHCPIIGGCSSDASKQREGGEMAVSWIQISSGSSSDYTKNARDGRGDWTEMGIAFAVCYPSVETYVAWFSGYSPVGIDGEFCLGTVTKASNKTIYEINRKPAADVYHEWLEVAAETSNTNLAEIGFPRLGNLHPLGTMIDFVEDNQRESNGRSLSSVHSNDWARLINTNAVITAINDDGSLSTTGSIAPGTNVVLMETSAESLKNAIDKMGRMAVTHSKFHVNEIVGCLMFLSAGVQALLGHKSMAEMVGAYRDWSGGACLMGMTTFGEIGHLPESTDFPHYDSLMFGSIVFSNRKRKNYLYF
ncbi:hypothetical protein Poli38472_005942 [Pythium oligandrum]|uniref:FYVE-type domain-containing protein n=1 Tax=Pythium oligandrum TaxID=41045 RepID=A0A8K1FPL0_PYTOL|nr:hypothetical protein Poli38472_005942 [Pythium oligandrum]|eukprot:TMW68474.1 hypothetical protein Poli38472_005942 [Pythium oligandrum]